MTVLVKEREKEGFETEVAVEFVNRNAQIEKKSFKFNSARDPYVKAGVLKNEFLNWFDESPVILEDEPETDENQSFHLVGIDRKGDAISFRDEENVDIKTYNRFEVSPRTAGGSQEENRHATFASKPLSGRRCYVRRISFA